MSSEKRISIFENALNIVNKIKQTGNSTVDLSTLSETEISVIKDALDNDLKYRILERLAELKSQEERDAFINMLLATVEKSIADQKFSDSAKMYKISVKP